MSLLMMQHYHPQFRSAYVCTHEHIGLHAYTHTNTHTPTRVMHYEYLKQEINYLNGYMVRNGDFSQILSYIIFFFFYTTSFVIFKMSNNVLFQIQNLSKLKGEWRPRANQCLLLNILISSPTVLQHRCLSEYTFDNQQLDLI